MGDTFKDKEINQELITVVIPIYKVEIYLDKCITSIINQTYTNLEIILVDDGSPDGCPAICDAFAQKDSRITVIHKKNGGLSDARNAGLNIAKGKYITFVDSDDYIGIHFIEELYTSISNYDADISFCDYVSVIDNVGVEKRSGKKQALSNAECLKMIYNPQIHGMEFVAWGKLYKIELFQDNGIKYPVGKIHEDTFTTYKLLYNARKILFTNSVEYFYRQRTDSIMTSTFDLKRIVVIDATREACDFFLQQHEPELFDMAVNTHFRTNILMYSEMHKNKRNINNYKIKKDNLVHQYRKDITKYLNHTNIKMKNKAFYMIFYYLHLSCLGSFFK